MRKAKLIAAIVLLVLTLVVVLQNTQSVETDLLWIHVEMPRVALLGLTLAVGVGVGYLLATWRQKKKAGSG